MHPAPLGRPIASEPGPAAALVAQHLTKIYGAPEAPVRALRDVDLTVDAGSFAAVTGPSGSGKSTLLHVVAGLEPPTSGRVLVDGHDLGTLSDDAIAAFRRRNIGLVFQFFNLLPTLNVRENVALPLLLDGNLLGSVADRADALLNQLGLWGMATKRPTQLSGGEMQRVAIARALVIEPRLILADEPTGSLDSRNGEEVIKLFRRVVDDRGVTVVVMTHDPRVAAAADRVIKMRDGEIEAAA